MSLLKSLSDLLEKTMRSSDSLRGREQIISRALRDSLKGDDPYDAPWVRETFEDSVVYEWQGQLYRVGYTLAENNQPTFGKATRVELAYVDAKEAAASGGPDLVEADLSEAYLPLLERSVDGDGTMKIKIIQPGWGSSGYYGADMLKENAAAFKGAKMYWNHPTAMEERARPERDLRDLAAEIVSDPVYEAKGKDGPGLYAKAKVFKHYKEAVEELAPHIGVSIRAKGEYRLGEAEGKQGPIIEKIVSAKSVDFVTEPGAGGKILSLFESARPSPDITPIQEVAMDKELSEALAAITGKLDAIEADNRALREAMDAERTRQARQSAAVRVLADIRMPAKARERALERALAGDATIETIAEAARSAAEAELAYLAEATGSPVKGLGGGELFTETSADEATKTLEAAFSELGLSESAVKVAVAGRV